ncbi:MAG: signal recognition particle protein Srp19 [Candidatus Methanomethylicia archaeon]|nr:signal recognition particle protein Srp19 [Candidatus Methanomethylicia archaeon]MCX8169214.1 signal recognition particle protein Srp19 [Candidatus Methanomethylicia archaeon]MDW7989004.1 signal recognition particle subunit SRP19/SEC65 family protein [Nitrososphaerota archaeon]
MSKKRMIVIWPAYLDATLTRSRGRRIPKEIAVSNPTLQEIKEAIKELNLNFIVEEGKKYPKMWFKDKGRILVEKSGRKIEIIKKIALIINQKRNLKIKIEKVKKK